MVECTTVNVHTTHSAFTLEFKAMKAMKAKKVMKTMKAMKAKQAMKAVKKSNNKNDVTITDKGDIVRSPKY